MDKEIKEILEKPNVYSFGDECYLYFGDYNKLKYYITNLQQRIDKTIECIEENIIAWRNLKPEVSMLDYDKIMGILKGDDTKVGE